MWVASSDQEKVVKDDEKHAGRCGLLELTAISRLQGEQPSPDDVARLHDAAMRLIACKWSSNDTQGLPCAAVKASNPVKTTATSVKLAIIEIKHSYLY